MTVDSHFDAATTEAVKEWQTSLGVDATGSVAPVDVVFAPGARRVLGSKSAIGNAVTPGMELLTVSGTDTVATVEAPVQGPGSLQLGDHVDLDLGGRAQTGGTVRTVSRDVTRASTTAPPQVAVDITPDDQGAAGLLVDGTIVTATVVVARGTTRLAVPVSALHDGPNGSALVTVVDKSGRAREAHVTPGVSGDGLVQIAGGDLAAGDRIVLG
jgi:multidrug efflux pump subunit AcrA (membrane-fusion protein)